MMIKELNWKENIIMPILESLLFTFLKLFAWLILIGFRYSDFRLFLIQNIIISFLIFMLFNLFSKNPFIKSIIFTIIVFFGYNVLYLHYPLTFITLYLSLMMNFAISMIVLVFLYYIFYDNYGDRINR